MDNAAPGPQHGPFGVPRHARRRGQRHLRAAVRHRPANGSTRTASSTRSSAAGRWLASSRGRAARRSASSRHAARSTASRPLGLRRQPNFGNPISCNTAFSTMSAEEIKGLLGIHKQADGKIFWIDPKVVDPVSGRAVGADNLTNAAGFDGQVFFNPTAGQVGNLPILAFDGPAQFRIDFALSKRIRITRSAAVRAQGRGVQPDEHAELLPRRHGHQQHDVRPSDGRQHRLARRPVVD